MAVTYEDIFDRYMEAEIDQVTRDLTFNVYTSGYLKQYHWYKIIKVGTTTDFTSVGAPNNTLGTRFQANTSLVIPTWDTGELQTGKTQVEYINEYIDNARVELNGFATQSEQTVDETNIYQKEFLICWTMALMCEIAGLTDKAQRLKDDGLRALYALWGSVVYQNNNSEEANIPPVSPVAVGIVKAVYTDFDAEMGWGQNA
jgi:hypothetical protein